MEKKQAREKGSVNRRQVCTKNLSNFFLFEDDRERLLKCSGNQHG